MATIKAFTDLGQSKVLAEILSLESADMHYGNFSPKGLGYEDKFSAGLTSYIKEIKVYEELKESYNIKDYNGIVAWRVIPCWSLSALLSVLPPFTIDSSDDHYFRIHCQQKFSEWHDNLIDACYEMIIKLKELNLL